jgi:hypothetical protein
MQNGTIEKIRLTTVGHFSLESVTPAKDTLWKAADNNVIGEKPLRRGTPLRIEKEAHVTDIFEALGKLDRANKVPLFALDALSLSIIPIHKYEDLSNITLIERLSKLKGIAKSLQETTDMLACENIVIKEKLDENSTRYVYAAITRCGLITCPIHL